jgi:hypothetical protein
MMRTVENVTSIETAREQFNDTGLTVVEGIYTPDLANQYAAEGFYKYFVRPTQLEGANGQIARRNYTPLRGSALDTMVELISSASDELNIDTSSMGFRHNMFLAEIAADGHFRPGNSHGALALTALENRLLVIKGEEECHVIPGSVAFVRSDIDTSIEAETFSATALVFSETA